MQIVCSFQTTAAASRTYVSEDSSACTCCVPSAFSNHLSPRRCRAPADISTAIGGASPFSTASHISHHTAASKAPKSVSHVHTAAGTERPHRFNEGTDDVAAWEVDLELLNAWKAIEPAVTGIVTECMKADGGGQWAVLCTGHSLGGAIATIAAHRLAATEYVHPCSDPSALWCTVVLCCV